MNYEGIIKFEGQYLTASDRRAAAIGDIVTSTGWYDTYENGQRRLFTRVQRVCETRGDIIRIDGPAGAFESANYTVLRPITAAEVERCRSILAESETLLAANKRVSFGKNRGKSIATEFQRAAAQHSIEEQRRILSEMAAQVS